MEKQLFHVEVVLLKDEAVEMPPWDGTVIMG